MGLRYYHAPRLQPRDSPGPLGGAIVVQMPEEVEELWAGLSSSARRQIEEIARQLRRQ